jgi:hypothetical protein
MSINPFDRVQRQRRGRGRPFAASGVGRDVGQDEEQPEKHGQAELITGER